MILKYASVASFSAKSFTAARMGSDAPDMVVPGRRLLLEGNLYKQCRKAGSFLTLNKTN